MTRSGPELQTPHADCGRCAHWLSWECVDCDRKPGGTSDRFEPRAGEQSPTSDELEIDRLRLEVAKLRRERDQLKFAVWGLTTELEGEVEELDRPRGGQQVTRITALTCGMRVPSVATWVRRTARDLRAVLDQGAR